MTFEEIFTNYSDFNDLVIAPLKSHFPSYEFLNEEKTAYTFNQIFFYLQAGYIGRTLRYDKTLFVAKFSVILLQELAQFYIRTIAWKNQELDVLKDYKNRDDNISSTTTLGTQNQQAQTNSGFSGTGITIDDTTKLSHKSISRNSGTDEMKHENYNIINNLKSIMNAKINFGIKELVGEFNDLFMMFVAFHIEDINNY